VGPEPPPQGVPARAAGERAGVRPAAQGLRPAAARLQGLLQEGEPAGLVTNNKTPVVLLCSCPLGPSRTVKGIYLVDTPRLRPLLMLPWGERWQRVPLVAPDRRTGSLVIRDNTPRRATPRSVQTASQDATHCTKGEVLQTE
jgi:hypothetical protein